MVQLKQMKKQIDYFLLGLLWLLAATLGISFWFNTKFGFNIFSGQHWEYLGHIQASNTTIQPAFYMSMIIGMIVMLGGLYLIIRPRPRKINIQSRIPERPVPPQNKPIIVQQQPVITPEPVTVAPQPITTPLVRPPRLALPKINNYAALNPGMGISATQQPASTNSPISISDLGEIEKIFESTGYLIKKPPRIDNFYPTLFAIGADEVLWIGAIDTESERLSRAAEKLQEIFTDTLEEIQIKINTFVINPKPDVAGIAPNNTEKFDNLDALREYMNKHPSRTLTESEREDFDAYSEYIDTVANYFNKV